jgi:uncharacterized metal-binding protein YceD (DUF177 family)
MFEPLTIPLEALEKGPFRLQGALPGHFLELENEVAIRNVGDVAYDLTAERLQQEVLIRGSIEAPMELECVRSGLFFSTIVRDSAFLRDYSIGDLEGDLNITEDVREAVVIEIPAYPVSPEAQSEDFEIPRLPGEFQDDSPPGPDKSPWKDLDQFTPNEEPPA